MKNLRFLLIFSLISTTAMAQYEFSGQVDESFTDGSVYLSVVEDYRKISGVYPEQILQQAKPKEDNSFTFTGDNLPGENRIYRIHVDTCSEYEQNLSHFNGHCENSREVLFIANNADTLSLPLTFDAQMFCDVVSTNERSRTFLKIDSLRSDMRYEFGTYRSDANKKINTEKWFTTFHNFGENLNEPLAELYIYSFLSDRGNDLYSYYLEDLKTSNYYDGLLGRLKASYPEATYTKQFEAELNADKFTIYGEQKREWPIWLLSIVGIAVLSILGNIYLLGKVRKLKLAKNTNLHLLSNQERKVLDLILESKTNKEIANEMFVSLSTVKTHINNLYKKLKVSSREEAMKLFDK